MSETVDGGVSYEAVCPECDEARTVMRGAPWREDVCIACGASVERGPVQ